MWPLLGREIRAAIGGEGGASADDANFSGVAVRGGWQPGDVLFALDLNGQDGHAHVAEYLRDGGKLAIVTRDHDGAGVIRVDDVYEAFKRLATWMRPRFTFPVIAIAGANGKTTTKEMTRAVLTGGGQRVSATHGTENGHYGVPLTLLDRAHFTGAVPSALVVEIGIDEVGTMHGHAEIVRPDLAVITSLGEEHLRGLHDERTAATEERELFAFEPRARRILDTSSERLLDLVAEQKAGDVTVVDAQDERALARARANEHASRVEYRIGPFDGTARELTFDISGGHGLVRVPLPSEAHARLAALAVATGHALGRSSREIEEGFASFRPVRGRAEILRLDRDLVLVDDSFNASPDSTRLAIGLLREAAWAHRPKAIFLGDMLDLGAATDAAHATLVPELRALRGAHIRLFGDAMERVYRAIVESPHELGSIAHARSRDDPMSLLDGPWASLEGALVVVKGSRGMRLERITSAIEHAYAKPRPLPARPSFAKDFFTVGVTGTNGKSSTTTWIAALLARKHAVVARATTLGYYVGNKRLDYPFDFDGFVDALAQAHRQGARACALEVTSEALQHGFAKVWPFHVGVFTNLTHDHLDVHTTPEHYLASKAQLFVHLDPSGVAVLNACDPASALLREVLPPSVSVLTYGVASRGEPQGDVDLFAHTQAPANRVTLERSTRAQAFPAELVLGFPALDIFVENALAAALGAWAAGVSPEDVARALSEVELPEGRFEVVAEKPWVVVDYAHTPDALSRTLTAARRFASGRVVLVFGAGGDRDARKRGPMGAAARLADVIYVTNDNPRTEDPMAIARELVGGIGDHPCTTIELDRARAIESAIEAASPRDVVLICGKGHETDQTIGTTRHRFSDREAARAAHERHCV